MNKKGIELSINFVVMLILAIAMLGGSLYIVSKFFEKTIITTKNLDKQTESELERMIAQGEKTIIPFNVVNVRKGDSKTFGLGILNVLGDTMNFTVNITGKNISGCDATDSTGDSVFNPNNIDENKINVIYQTSPYTVKNNEHVKAILVFWVGKKVKTCQHVYDVKVEYVPSPGASAEIYNRVEKIYINVV